MKLGIEQAGPVAENRLEGKSGPTFLRLPAAIEFLTVFAKRGAAAPHNYLRAAARRQSRARRRFLRRVHRSVAETLDGCRSGGYLRR
ncbi:MAG TPA: hypothetical protein VJ180_08940 [Pyrinomonadaceae bacterium]|nr:hypothetical protein [Pyrinomonadaceae bacterium]